MSAIEPNLGALLWYALLCVICCLAFLVLAGMFPLDLRDERAKRPGGLPLVIGDALLLAGLAVGTAAYAWGSLRWTTLVVAGGLAFLFSPALFQAWPEAWRDGRLGLTVVLLLLIGGLALLQAVSMDAS